MPSVAAVLKDSGIQELQWPVLLLTRVIAGGWLNMN